MLAPRPRKPSAHLAERGAPVVALLPHPDDRPLLRTALAVARARGTRLRAWSMLRRGADLHPALRIARYGMAAHSEADRAIRHLVDSAVRGSHVPVRVFSTDDAERGAEFESLTALPGDALLLAGAVRGGEEPDPEALLPLAERFAGPLLLVSDPGGPAFREVLAIAAGREDGTARSDADLLLQGLERGYPVWRKVLRSPDGLLPILADVRADTLTVLVFDETRLLGTLDGGLGGLASRLRGPLAVVLPAGEGRRERVALLLGLEDETPTQVD